MNTSPFSDEELMAYADGELDAERSAEICRACQTDARTAAKVEMFRASRRLLSDAFEPVMQEPVPDRLLQVIQGLDDDRRADSSPQPRLVRPQTVAVRRRARWTPALAASVTAIGAFTAGWFFHVSPQVRGSPGAIVAGVAPLANAVQVALERTVSGEVVHGHIDGSAVDILPLSTFSDGAVYCREFDVTQTGGAASSTLRGVACRDGQHWVARVMSGQAATPAADDSYQAASGGADLSRTIGNSVAVSPEQERDLIAHAWKTP